MRFISSRRAIAAVAVAGLIVAVTPAVATSANAATACAPGTTCEGSLTGTLGASPFKIIMPEKFNGTVLMYFHGYRMPQPIPGVFAGPMGMATDPFATKVSIPALAATFGSDVAYVGNNNAEVAPSATVQATLLSQGYALVGAGYARQGWATPEGLEAGNMLLRYIKGGAIAGVKKTMTWGESMGGAIAQTVAERNPGAIAGSLPACGVMSGPLQSLNSALSIMFAWKTLIAPTLRVSNYQSYNQALGDLATILGTLGAVATKPVSAAGFPIAQANMLAGLLGGEPTNSSVYDGITPNPAFATLGTLPAVAGGYSPSSGNSSSVVAMLQNVGSAAALAVMARYDMEQRARGLANIPADQPVNLSDNVNVSYTNLLSFEQLGQFGDTLNTAAGYPDGLLNTMLGNLDASRGNPAVRYAATPAAVKAIAGLPHPTGKYVSPTLLLSTAYDPLISAGNTEEYWALLKASAKKQGVKLPKISKFYTVPPADGWTKFLPGAKSPDAALSVAALNGSGVGHCNFSRDGGVQLVNSVAALNRLVNARDAAQIKAANKLVYGTTGVNGDGFYNPDPLKHPELSR